MIEQGQIVLLEDNKEYICVQNIIKDNENFLYLVSNFKPLEVRFAKQIQNSNDFSLEIINNKDQKIELLKLFQNNSEMINAR